MTGRAMLLFTPCPSSVNLDAIFHVLLVNVIGVYVNVYACVIVGVGGGYWLHVGYSATMSQFIMCHFSLSHATFMATATLVTGQV